MKPTGILLGLLFGAILMAAHPAFADGRAPTWRYNAHSAELPFPRSARAEFGLGLKLVLDRLRIVLRLGIGRLP